MQQKEQEKRIRNLREIVEKELSINKKARNDDQFLTLSIWWRHYPEYFIVHECKYYIKADAVLSLPREDNIKRLRAKIQNEERKYLPDDPIVRKKRGISEEVWLKYCTYN
jgi:hypothetical protein